MGLAEFATPADYRKLTYLRHAFAQVLHALDTLNFPDDARQDARPIIKAASVAEMYDGEYEPVVRKYYAFSGDFRRVWFTLDLFTIMPEKKTPADERTMRLLIKRLTAALIEEIRPGLREELLI